ncbi:MAG TPA: ABC transporter ATP-binding protein [Candidatus Limnocylindria bacterium]|nr:ABC transporter ATP-binding protein [Candidatus Limnocylindria bacterium]
MGSNIVKTLGLMRSLRPLIVANVVVAAIVGGLTAFLPFSIKLVLDKLINSLDSGITLQDILLGPLLIWLALRVTLIIAEYVHNFVWDRLMPRAIALLREITYEKSLSLSLEYYEKVRVGEITHLTMNAPLEFMPEFLREMSENMLPKLSAITVALVLLAGISPSAALVAFLAFAVLLAINYHKLKLTKVLRYERNEHVKEMNGYVNEGYSLVRHLFAMGELRARSGYVREKSQSIIKIADRLHGLERRYNVIFGIINLSVFFAVFVLTINEILRGRQSPSIIPMIAVYLGLFTESALAFSRFLGRAADVEATQQQLHELLAQTTSVIDRPDAKPLKSIQTVELRDVYFAYDKNEALRGVSFKVEKGQKLALIGMSGAGKSTIIKLLLRFYDVDSGAILINGEDIRNYAQEDVRRCFGTVLQDVALFNDTVEENVRMVKPKASDSEVKKAAESAHATAFIQNLPEGFKTVVGERGVKLSGGQQQRIAIARAMLRKPTAVILDEATSALDTESERAVQAGLEELLEGRLSIVIAHRLSTVRNADTIVVLENGQVAEIDNHAGLLKRQGYYARLVKMQAA